MTGKWSAQSPDGSSAERSRTAVVVTCSDRAAAGTYADRSGPYLAARLRELGWSCADPHVVPDGPAVTEALARALETAPGLLLTTGGTGLAPRDRTPEATRGFLAAEVPGIAEAIRAAGVGAGVPTAMLSRGIAGFTAGGTLVVNVPGSLNGARDAMTVLEPVLAHAVDQVRGGDH